MIVMSKASKRHGVVYPSSPTEYQAYFGNFVKGGYDSITIHKAQRDGTIKQGVTLKVGDTCEQDSYNLSYHGTIIKITEKAIHVQKEYGGGVKRMSLYEFCWRNFDFDAAESTRKNYEEMMYL